MRGLAFLGWTLAAFAGLGLAGGGCGGRVVVDPLSQGGAGAGGGGSSGIGGAGGIGSGGGIGNGGGGGIGGGSGGAGGVGGAGGSGGGVGGGGGVLCVPEVCDGLDNDCDGQIDSGPCGCGGTSTCVNGQLVCSSPGGVYFEEDFSDNSAGWTLGATWQIGPAQSSSGELFGNPDPAVDHSASNDNGVAGVVIGGNAPTNQHPAYYLTSPTVDASTAATVTLTFWRWLNSDYTPYMQNSVEVWNGSLWVTLWQSGGPPGIEDSAWQAMSYDLTPYKNAALRVRFGHATPVVGAFEVSSWNIDDVIISSGDCP